MKPVPINIIPAYRLPRDRRLHFHLTDDYKDTSAYIEEVCMINHIFPDDIHEGEYLTVPYYSAEYLK